MKKILVACCLLLGCLTAHAHGTPDAALRQQVNAFIDEWHDDAVHARMAFFDKIAPEAIVAGGDERKLWINRFERKRGWIFKPTQRNVYVSADKKYIWFDEQIDTQAGVFQGSGVIRMSETGFKIENYQLTPGASSSVVEQASEDSK
jgi:hypothetical protein